MLTDERSFNSSWRRIQQEVFELGLERKIGFCREIVRKVFQWCRGMKVNDMNTR